jgi:hypothetical protein
MKTNEMQFKLWLLKKGPVSHKEAAMKGRELNIPLNKIIKIYRSI